MQLDTVLIKVASRCNINCKYCYVYNMGDDGWKKMPTQISQDTVENIASCLKNYIDEKQKPLAVVLHGGEPLLLGEKKVKSSSENSTTKLANRMLNRNSDQRNFVIRRNS